MYICIMYYVVNVFKITSTYYVERKKTMAKGCLVKLTSHNKFVTKILLILLKRHKAVLLF